MKYPDPETQLEVPFGNIFFKQLDDVMSNCARANLKELWEKCSKINDPNERLRTYW